MWEAGSSGPEQEVAVVDVGGREPGTRAGGGAVEETGGREPGTGAGLGASRRRQPAGHAVAAWGSGGVGLWGRGWVTG